MRPKIAIGILIVFCFAEIRPLLPFLDYYVNYEYITEVLCINKEKPKSTCNGKCYLSKQLKEAQKTEKQDEKLPTVEQERIPMIVYNSELPKFLITFSDAIQYSEFYQFSIKDLSISPPTPPPKC
jgi:hypothetical protein